MTLRFAGLVTLIACLVSGCEEKCPEGPHCTLKAQGSDGGATAMCIAGAWRAAGDGGSCSPIPCRGDAGPPECAQSDCVQQSVLVFVPSSDGSSEGTMFSASFVASRSRGTWSNPIAPERFRYAVDGGQLATDAGAGPRAQSVTCTSEQLVLGEIALKTRSSQAESDGLSALMVDGGTWSGLPLP